MELYLIRHGIAGDRADYLTDGERPLIKKGRKKTKKVAKKLSQMGVQFDLILTSPLVRAQQTAEILLQKGLSSTVEEFASLAPDQNISGWIEWLGGWRNSHSPDSQIALVGHQPDLGNWAELLVWGSASEKLIVKKAGIIGLKIPEFDYPIGKSELFLLTAPKWFLSEQKQ